MVFVFLWLTYFTQHIPSRNPCCCKWEKFHSFCYGWMAHGICFGQWIVGGNAFVFLLPLELPTFVMEGAFFGSPAGPRVIKDRVASSLPSQPRHCTWNRYPQATSWCKCKKQYLFKNRSLRFCDCLLQCINWEQLTKKGKNKESWGAGPMTKAMP